MHTPKLSLVYLEETKVEEGVVNVFYCIETITHIYFNKV